MTATHQPRSATADLDALVADLATAHAPLPDLAVTDRLPHDVEADVLVVLLATDGDDVVLRRSRLAESVVDELTATLRSLDARAGAGETLRLPAPAGVAASSVLAVGTGSLHLELTGDEPAIGPEEVEVLRRAAGAAGRALAGVGHAVLAVPADTLERLDATLVGVQLGAYAFTRYKEAKRAPLGRVTVSTRLADDKGDAALERAAAVGRAVAGARSYVNSTPNHLTPAVFAEAARRLGEERGCEVEVLDEAALREGGYGAICGVGQGSTNPPRLVRVTWDGTASGKEITFVGKGITFDSGGLSLKPPASMETMKDDMAGAATVLHVVLAAAELKLPVRTTAWLALAENMPSGSAQRPSDVVTARDGTTIEVLNTDAEGRLAMADALVAARERAGEDIELLIDVATLTGAQVIALGTRISGVMGDRPARERILEAAAAAGEGMWPAPVPHYLREEIDSPIADIKNKGERSAGMLGAGAFLRHFAGDTTWAHIDIAGPAFHEGAPWGVTPKGGTGAAVATLLTLLENSTR